MLIGYTHRRSLIMLELELFSLLEGTSDAAFTVTEMGEIRSWNKAAQKLFEYSAAEALKSTCHKILQGRGALGTEVCGENCSIRDCAAKHLEIPNFDLEAKARSGRRLWVSVSTLVFENPRTHQRLIVHLAHDITERKKNEELLRTMINVSRQLVAIPDVVVSPSPILPLSEQEIEILRSFSVGNNSGVIARKLKITLQTLRNHLHHINQKLHTHNRLEAVTHAMQRKLL
jgi:PAS domain S-box-containing protein